MSVCRLSCPAPTHFAVVVQVPPRGLQSDDRPGRIIWARTAERKDVALGANAAEALLVPLGVMTSLVSLDDAARHHLGCGHLGWLASFFAPTNVPWWTVYSCQLPARERRNIFDKRYWPGETFGEHQSFALP